MYGVWKSFFLRNIDNHFHGFQTHGIDMVDNLMFDVFEMFHIYVTISRKCIIMFISNSLLSIYDEAYFVYYLVSFLLALNENL